MKSRSNLKALAVTDEEWRTILRGREAVSRNPPLLLLLLLLSL
jgi:hypothetical protein